MGESRMSGRIEGWTRHDEAFWRAHHEAWKRSDLNQREYCEAQQIPLKAFGNWRAQFKLEKQRIQHKLLYRRGGEALVHVPAVRTREIINTIGAGDALFSAFVFNFARGLDAVEALRRAVVFASWKIGEKGAADGFLDAASLERLYAEHAAATAPRTH